MEMTVSNRIGKKVLCPYCSKKAIRKSGGRRLPSGGYECNKCNIVFKIYQRI